MRRGRQLSPRAARPGLAPAVVAACGGGASPAPGSSGAATASGLVPGGLGPPASLPPAATPLVRIDPALLKVLPDSVEGQSVLESSEVDADASANASLARIADSAVGAIAIDPAAGDFVLPLVVRLRPSIFDDAGFRNWRDSFDAGVCGGNGVAGHAQSQIGGRTVYVATCGGSNALHTYHVWIPDSNLLVSASAGGTRNFGEVLFGTLRP